MTYVDGFVFAVPTANKEKFREHAAKAAPFFREHGALEIKECWGDDVPQGETNSFHTAVLCKEDETVCFSWVIWPSKEVRDAAMEDMMSSKDPRMDPAQNPMPFDGKRMIFGGFTPVVEA